MQHIRYFQCCSQWLCINCLFCGQAVRNGVYKMICQNKIFGKCTVKTFHTDNFTGKTVLFPVCIAVNTVTAAFVKLSYYPFANQVFIIRSFNHTDKLVAQHPSEIRSVSLDNLPVGVAYSTHKHSDKAVSFGCCRLWVVFHINRLRAVKIQSFHKTTLSIQEFMNIHDRLCNKFLKLACNTIGCFAYFFVCKRCICHTAAKV